MKYWSIIRGGLEARVSAVDGMGDEYYALIDGSGGKAYRERRVLALDIIEAAMLRGDGPGEVDAKELADVG